MCIKNIWTKECARASSSKEEITRIFLLERISSSCQTMWEWAKFNLYWKGYEWKCWFRGIANAVWPFVCLFNVHIFVQLIKLNDLCISYCKPSTIWYNFQFGISSDNKSLFCIQSTVCFPFPQLFMTLLWDSPREGCRLQVPSNLLPSNPFHDVRNPFWRCWLNHESLVPNLL